MNTFDVERWLGSFEPARCILWVGAGVSADPPSRLPLGHALTDFALEEACGAPVRERLLRLWERANRICTELEVPLPFAARPRLETVLGGVAELERDARDPSLAFLPALTAFAEAPPNALHFALAALALRGAAVFTSNFDLCVERAVRRLAGRDDVFSVAGTERVRRFVLRKDVGRGEIVHFHGVADEPEHLGATLARVKEGLPQPFDALEERLDRGAVLLMAGYSASDAFDVTPYFVRQPPGRWPRSALVFVRHGGAPAPAHLREMAAGFGAVAEHCAHTGDVLLRMAETAAPAGVPDFDWMEACRSRLPPRADTSLMALRTCAVAHALGINVDVLDAGAYASAEARNPGFAPARYHTLLAMAGRERGVPARERAHTARAEGLGASTLGADYAQGHLRSALRRALPPEQIRAAAEGTAVLSWPPYTSLSAHVRALLAPFLPVPWLRPRGKRLAAVEGLRTTARLLAERPYPRVQVLRQLVTARRMVLLLDALRGEAPAPGLERDILALYAETADLAGYVSTYRDFAIARLLRSRFAHASQRRALLREAADYTSRSAALAAVLGDGRGLRRARQLRVLSLLHRMYAPFAPALTPPAP